MFTTAFFIAVALSALAALPGDWARRNASRKAANLLNLADLTAIAATVALAAALGPTPGFGGVLALLSGVGAGQQLADALANRLWGPIPATN